MMVSRNWDESTVGTHDVNFFVECPRSVELLDDACQETLTLAVVRLPYHWDRHEGMIKKVMDGKAARLLRRELDKLERVKQLVTAAPLLTQAVLDRFGLSEPSLPSSSCAPAPLSDGVRETHKAREVP
jgi:hypothetical protein